MHNPTVWIYWQEEAEQGPHMRAELVNGEWVLRGLIPDANSAGSLRDRFYGTITRDAVESMWKVQNGYA